MNEQIEEVLRGSYDLHVHAAPDGSQERRMDALEVARYAYEAEMGGFVLKSHDYNTAPLTYALNQIYPGLNVFWLDHAQPICWRYQSGCGAGRCRPGSEGGLDAHAQRRLPAAGAGRTRAFALTRRKRHIG